MNDLKYWKDAGEYFTYCGQKIFHIEGGKADGPVLLLIHGFPTASWDWHKIWKPLCKDFRVLAIDMIGFGLSAKPKNYDYSILDQADLFEAFLNLKGVARYHMLAHDYGLTVAQELLARDEVMFRGSANKRIASMVLLNGGIFPEAHKPVLIQKLLISPLGGLVARLSTFGKFKNNFEKICSQPLADDELRTFWGLLLRDNGRAIMPRLIRYMEERKIHRERWVGALQTTKTPIRLINGIEDPISGAHMLERYRELIANPDIIELSQVGHYPQVEAPDEVLKAAFEFWQPLLILT